jgi:putative transposase
MPQLATLALAALFDNYLREVTPQKGRSKESHDQRAAKLFLEYLGPTRKVVSLNRRDWDGFIRRRRARGIAHRPDELWGTDATLFDTQRDGWCWFFGAIDHCVEDVVGWHVAKVGDRWAALEPIRQGVRQTLGGYALKIALRMDRGPQYTAHQFLGELRWPGIRPTPSYVGEPECNGMMERWIRTLKEECVYLQDFATLGEARQVISQFVERYNAAWLLERHGYRTPAEVRRALTRRAA